MVELATGTPELGGQLLQALEVQNPLFRSAPQILADRRPIDVLLVCSITGSTIGDSAGLDFLAMSGI